MSSMSAKVRCHPGESRGPNLINRSSLDPGASPRVALFIILTILSLTACGFTPLYADRNNANTSITQNLNNIAISPIPDRDGQALRNALIDRFYLKGSPRHPTMTLNISPLIESKTDLDVTENDEATRRQLRLSTTLTLKDENRADPLLTRSLYAIVSYNVLESQFTTRVAEQTSRDNAVADLARQIEQSLIIYFKSAPPK